MTKKYIVTARRIAGSGKVAGDAIELTAEQAASALYRNRVRLADVVEPELEGDGKQGKKAG